MRLGVSVPLNKEQILKAVDGVDEVLVVEELEPIVETQLKNILFDEDVRLKVHGKDYVPRTGELTFEKVGRAVAKFLGLQLLEFKEPEIKIPDRPPALCPGCPHRSSFIDLKRGIVKGGLNITFFSGDIGCYSLGVLPPFNVQDSLIEMGSSLGIANGVFRATNTIPVAVIGGLHFLS